MTRYAAYYAPTPEDPLWAVGCNWLGRDPTGATCGLSPVPDAVTAAPRGYGFHATLKPPFQLADGFFRADVLTALTQVATGVPAFDLPPLSVADWHGFLCLRETRESAALQALADAAVAGLDHLRAAPAPAELARRRAGGLSPAREANLVRWGYPDVFASWFFHMTLTGRSPGDDVRQAAEAWFAASLAQPRRVEDVCLFEQAEPGAPFLLTDRVRLG